MPVTWRLRASLPPQGGNFAFNQVINHMFPLLKCGIISVSMMSISLFSLFFNAIDTIYNVLFLLSLDETHIHLNI